MNETLRTLIKILERANDEGHCTETELDRELFAKFLIDNGVYLSDVEVNSEPIGEQPCRTLQPCEIWGDCPMLTKGYCSHYNCFIGEIKECEYYSEVCEVNNYDNDEEES